MSRRAPCNFYGKARPQGEGGDAYIAYAPVDVRMYMNACSMRLGKIHLSSISDSMNYATESGTCFLTIPMNQTSAAPCSNMNRSSMTSLCRLTGRWKAPFDDSRSPLLLLPSQPSIRLRPAYG